MSRPRFTFLLKLEGKRPENLTPDQLCELIKHWAALLGTDNLPAIRSITSGSIKVATKLGYEASLRARRRMVQARMEPDSKAAASHRCIERLMSDIAANEAVVLDNTENVVHRFEAQLPQGEEEIVRVRQAGSIDGVVTGVIGADDTMHLHLRDIHGIDSSLVVKDEQLARELIGFFRQGVIRLNCEGNWIRSQRGWRPESSKCTVVSFTPLDETPLSTLFSELAAVEGNGWHILETPEEQWREIRGLN